MQKQALKLENMKRLRSLPLKALEKPEPPWASPPPRTLTLQGEFIEMGAKLGVTIPADEQMVEVPLCLLKAIVEKLTR